MHSACGRYVIVFNGEVYNFAALRKELAPSGHLFRGHSDTEVMLAAIRQWGLEAAIRRFIGMFAFALWDREERRLHLVRDRLGIKPLFYGWAGRHFLFGSELKALRAHPAFKVDIDRDSIAELLRFGYIPAPHTIYRGVSKLAPGTLLTVSPERGPGGGETATYWDARSIAASGMSARLTGSDAELTDALDGLLQDSIGLRMISDVSLGAFLSGGIDSSTVVAIMQSRSRIPVKTFTIGFDEASYDEAKQAKAVARHLKTEHTELYVSPSDALALVPQIPEWYDEPFADSSQLPTYLVSQLSRRHVTVALSGDGGDELFAGYNRYYSAPAIWRIVSMLPKSVRRRMTNFLAGAPLDTLDRFASFLPRRYEGVRKSTESVPMNDGLTDVDAVYQHLLRHWESPTTVVIGAHDRESIPPVEICDFIERAQLLDLMTYLPDDILTKVDRASMAVGLEARVPLLDHRIVEFAWHLPFSVKLRERRRKWLLRQVLYRYVPRALVERPKMGFGVPIDVWLRGPLREWGETLLGDARLREDGYFDPATITARWREHLSGRRNWQYHLWNVLMFQAWKDKWLG